VKKEQGGTLTAKSGISVTDCLWRTWGKESARAEVGPQLRIILRRGLRGRGRLQKKEKAGGGWQRQTRFRKGDVALEGVRIISQPTPPNESPLPTDGGNSSTGGEKNWGVPRLFKSGQENENSCRRKGVPRGSEEAGCEGKDGQKKRILRFEKRVYAQLLGEGGDRAVKGAR